MSGRASRHVHAHAVSEGTRGLSPVHSRRLCAGCGERPPRFRYGGVVKRDADHTLCFACHRALGNRMRERQRRMVLWLPHRRAHARGVTPDATIVAA